MSKGSKRRPQQVSDKQVKDSWDSIFSDKSKIEEDTISSQVSKALGKKLNDMHEKHLNDTKP